MASSFIDRSTTLCLACSSSLPPLKGITSFNNANSIHITNCCQRPICPSCISSNPRLARYDPCLSCLGGVDVVSALRERTFPDQKGKVLLSPSLGSKSNLDGSLRDQDTFVLGDDDDDDLGNQDDGPLDTVAPPPPYEPVSALSENSTENSQSLKNAFQLPSLMSLEDSGSTTVDAESQQSISESSTRTTPYKYYLNRKDTLQGLALRFGLDGHEICRMNNLPTNVIRMTPHLLHTRSFVLLPPTAKPHPSLTISSAEEKMREEKLVRERAERKLQTLTKEADWRIAKAYVALADDAQEQDNFSAKWKEMGSGQEPGQMASTSKTDGLEALAVEKYLDDEEWEAEERRAGRDFRCMSFPNSESGKSPRASGKWWGRKV